MSPGGPRAKPDGSEETMSTIESDIRMTEYRLMVCGLSIRTVSIRTALIERLKELQDEARVPRDGSERTRYNRG